MGQNQTSNLSNENIIIHTIKFRILICGFPKSGKTSLLSKIINKKLNKQINKVKIQFDDKIRHSRVYCTLEEKILPMNSIENTRGVIFILDPRELSQIKLIQKYLDQIPKTTFPLVIINFSDISHCNTSNFNSLTISTSLKENIGIEKIYPWIAMCYIRALMIKNKENILYYQIKFNEINLKLNTFYNPPIIKQQEEEEVEEKEKENINEKEKQEEEKVTVENSENSEIIIENSEKRKIKIELTLEEKEELEKIKEFLLNSKIISKSNIDEINEEIFTPNSKSNEIKKRKLKKKKINSPQQLQQQEIENDYNKEKEENSITIESKSENRKKSKSRSNRKRSNRKRSSRNRHKEGSSSRNRHKEGSSSRNRHKEDSSRKHRHRHRHRRKEINEDL